MTFCLWCKLQCICMVVLAYDHVHLQIVYLAFCWNFFIKSVLNYTCTLKKFESVRKSGIKWGLKKH